jgi:hypothetical protein
VQEVAAHTVTQRGVSMTANHVYSIAGSASGSGYSGDGGLATSALLGEPVGLAIDATGDVYIGDPDDDVIVEVAGTTGTQWGKGMTANHIYKVAGRILPSGNSTSTKNTFTVPTAARTRSKFSHMVDFRSKCSSCINDSSSDNIIYASTAMAYRESTGNACYYRIALSQEAVSMGERTGLGLVEVTVLDALDVAARESGGRPFKSAKVVSMVEERIGLAPGYAYEVLIDLALPWKVPVILVRKGGNFGSRDGFPPMGFHETEAGLSPAGEVALAAERGEIAPVPIGLINGNAYRAGTRPPFRPQGIIDAIREVIRRPRVADDEITAIIGLPDFLTGCEVTGDLAALASGETTELTLRARITVDEGKCQLLVQDIPPSVDISWAYDNVSNQAGLYAEAKEDPGGGWTPGLPIEDVEPFFSHDSDLFVCTAAPGVSLEWLRDQVARIDGVVTTMKAALPRPLPDMVRRWATAHADEDVLASLAALEEAIHRPG